MVVFFKELELVRGKVEKQNIFQDKEFLECVFVDNFKETNFVDCNFENCNFDENFEGSTFTNCSFGDCSFKGDLTNLNFKGCGFLKAKVELKKYGKIVFDKCNIKDSVIKIENETMIDMSNCRLLMSQIYLLTEYRALRDSKFDSNLFFECEFLPTWTLSDIGNSQRKPVVISSSLPLILEGNRYKKCDFKSFDFSCRDLTSCYFKECNYEDSYFYSTRMNQDLFEDIVLLSSNTIIRNIIVRSQEKTIKD